MSDKLESTSKIVILSLMVFLISLAGFSYAYFNPTISGNETASSMYVTTKEIVPSGPAMTYSGTDSTTGLQVVSIELDNSTEEFYVISDSTNAIDYASLISTNGNIYNYDSNKTVLLAKYNLSSTTGLQTSSTTANNYVVRFSGTNYWYDGTNSAMYSKYGSSYNQSNIYDETLAAAPNSSNPTNADYSIAYYVEEYVDILGINGTGRLLTYTEANAMTQAMRVNGQNYWLGSAYGSGTISDVYSDGEVDSNSYRSGNVDGVRPVIVVNTSDIQGEENREPEGDIKD